MLIFLIATLLLVTTGSSQATCYAENDDIVADHDTPCGSADGVHCCGEGYYCLSNGLCQSKSDPPGFNQGTCTDPTYESPSCSSICRGSDEGGNAEDTQLSPLKAARLTRAIRDLPIRPRSRLMR